jgi:hypothetical protein
MAKKPNITNVASGYQSTTIINDNFNNIRNSFDNTLSLDGSTPNAMQADLDMNSNDILNVNSISVDNLISNGLNLSTVVQETAANAASAEASAISADISAGIALDAADEAASFAGFRDFDNLTSLLANTSLTYSGTGSNTVIAGQIIRTRKEGFSYTVAPAGRTVTISNANPAVISLTGHGFVVNTAITFQTTGSLPSGITANTTYFVRTVVNADSFQISAVPGGIAIETSSAGSGTHKVFDQQLTTAGGVGLYVTESESAYSAKAFGAVGDAVTDDTVALQKFFNFALANSGKSLTFDWSGEYGISAPINIAGDNNKYISGFLYCLSGVDVALNISGRLCDHSGYIRVYGNSKGTSTVTYSNRLITSAGVNIQTCFRSKFEGFYVEGSKRNGVQALTSRSGISPIPLLDIGRIVTISNASPAVVSLGTHGLVDNSPIYFTTTGTLPSPLVPNKQYYVKTFIDPSTAETSFTGFQVSATPGGPAINTTTAGSGTHRVFGAFIWNSITSSLGRISTWNCGSASPTEDAQNWNISFSFSGRTDTGTSGLFDQRSVLTSTSIPTELQVHDAVRISGEFYQVRGIDRSANTLTLYPWVKDLTATSGTIFSCHGAGVLIDASNSAGMTVDGIQALRCGIACYVSTLYGPQIKGLVAEVSSVALGIRSLNIGLTVTGFHPEVSDGNALGLLVIDRVDPTQVNISGISVYRPADIEMMVPITSTGEKVYKEFASLTLLDGSGGAVYSVGKPFGTAETNSFSLSNAPGNDEFTTTRWVGTTTINLTYEPDYDRLFGRKKVTVYQATANATETGGGMAITIQPSTADAALGITVMGAASYTLPSTINGRRIDMVYEPDNKNWIVIVSNWFLTCTGSKTFNPPSIAASASTTTTVTVTGAALGDYAEASFSLDMTGLVMSAYVSAADTVTVVLFNPTVGAVDLGSGTLKATAIRR